MMRAMLFSSDQLATSDLAAASPALPAELLQLAVADGQRAGGWLAPWVDFLQSVLVTFQEQLYKLHVPYSYGYSIILLTLFVKLVSFPLIKQQVESSLAVQSLKPRIELIKQRYGEDKDKIQKETSVLYEQAGVNPLAGCLPSLATIPIFIGLFNSLTNVANDGLLDTQGFYWVPSLAGPTSLAARNAGLGTSWLFPFVDGAPPIGWHDGLAYLALPVLILLAQYASNAITMPPTDPKDENARTGQVLMLLLPLMLSWFALNVPAGMSLYYFANTVLTSGQMIYLKKLGGAKVKVNDLGPVTKPGSGRKLGALAAEYSPWKPLTVKTTAEQKAETEAAAAAAEAAVAAAEAAAEAAESEATDGPTPSTVMASSDSTASVSGSMDAPVATLVDPAAVSRRVKRKKLSLIGGSGLPGAVSSSGTPATAAGSA